MRAERTQAYELHLTHSFPEVSCALAGNVLMATGPELSVPEAYRAYAGVFCKVDSKSIPSHSPQDLAAELLDGKQPPWGLIYNLSKMELNTLHSRLEAQLKPGWIRPSKSPA
jgi:hypothetical protein